MQAFDYLTLAGIAYKARVETFMTGKNHFCICFHIIKNDNCA